MEKGKGKLAIAIVAMFVVALSIIGFTYAYFVAQVKGNEEDNSVTVTAGILEIAYTGTNKVEAKSIVPGWKSDSKHFFDSAVYDTEDKLVNGNPVTLTKYTSCVLDAAENATTATATFARGEGVDPVVKTCDKTKASAATGILAPITFTVDTTERNTDEVSYAIILNGISNNLHADDKANFKYALCKGTCDATLDFEDLPNDGAKFTADGDDVLITKGTVGANGESIQVISGAETLADDTEQAYQVMLYYLEANTKQDSANLTGVEPAKFAVQATVEVIGIQKVGNNYVDGNGVTVITGQANN